MDDEVETLLVGVRADTAGFARDAASLRGTLEGALGAGAERAGAAIERGLARAVRTGRLGFEDLERVALGALNEIAARALSAGIGEAAGGGGSLVSLGSTLIGAALGLPGRATGGPVSPGAAYLVGERGPELFVPASAGSIAAAAPARAEPARPVAAPAPAVARTVNVAVSIAAPQGTEARALARSGRQVARAVADALAAAER